MAAAAAAGTGAAAAAERTLKVILLGDQSVGKTSLRSQFIHHVFSTAYRATIGGDYLTTTIDGTVLQIWDTAGQERFNSLSRTFYRGSDVAVLVYDLTRAETFQHLNNWINDFLENCHVATPAILIVGNKADKAADRQISLRQSREYATTSLNLVDLVDDVKRDVVELSAKNFDDVEKLFLRVAEVGAKKMEQFDTIVDYDNVDVTNVRSAKLGGCC